METVLTGFTHVVMLSASALLALAALHKARLLTRRERQSTLVNQLAEIGLEPRKALTAALFAEAAVVTLIYLAPIAGLSALVLMLAAYTAFLSRLPDEEDCGCFGEVVPATNREAIVRNAILAVAASVGAATAATYDVRPHLFGQVSVGVTLIVLALLIGTAKTTRLLRPVPTLMQRR
jgi:hypothetical protein